MVFGEDVPVRRRFRGAGGVGAMAGRERNEGVSAESGGTAVVWPAEGVGLEAEGVGSCAAADALASRGSGGGA